MPEGAAAGQQLGSVQGRRWEGSGSTAAAMDGDREAEEDERKVGSCGAHVSFSWEEERREEN